MPNINYLFKMWKSSVKLGVNRRVKLAQNFVQNSQSLNNLCKYLTFPHSFSRFTTNFFTSHPPLYLTNLFHYSTYPTITTTNKLIINNRKDLI